ncbi:MAG: hypothetical protein HYX91_04810 [Chloroflexi bacterium]|nr:hypothetical protein [Chloroflexota bacterium]
MRKRQKGFTLLQTVIGLAISGVLGTAIAAAIPMFMQLSPQQANKLGVEADLSFARYWINRDANAAESYTALTAPQYGRFTWRDFTGESTVSYNVTYSYDASSDSVIREERQDGVLQSSLPIARKILSQNDATFTWSPSTRRLTVALTATIEDAPGVGDHSRGATIVAALRPALEPTVSTPGEEPVPPPAPGSETYYISGEPTIIYGTLSSGSGSSLHDVDSVYYVVNSATVGGSKVVSWWAQGENMSAPATISQIEVRFTGKSNKQNVAMEFFVQDSDSGFPGVAASGFTFTQADTVVTHSFPLDPTALAYVNSLTERRVTLKVQGTTSAVFTLSSDQVLFIASP